MTEQNQQQLNELTALKAKADLMGIPYSPNIGLDTLRERVNKHLQDTEQNQQQSASAASVVVDTRMESMKLVRVIVTSMDQTKKDYPGEVFTVSNAVIPTIKRFVPFGIETHVEKILLDVIKDKQCLQLVEDSQAKIKGMKKKKIIRAYAVQEQPQLTVGELDELRKAQLARQSIE
jgi:hypothetical protein